LAALRIEDVEALSPPGFGSPADEAFGATSDDYLAWLSNELERIDGPVDLVGHDWGGGHVLRVAIERPDLIRSWATDIAGCLAPDYEWHDFAKVWQTAGAGEESVAEMISGSVSDRAARFETIGITPAVARDMAEAADETMGRCILALYRSAAQPAMSLLGGRLSQAASRPGLVIIPTEDPFTGGEERARWAASKAGAQVGLLNGLGHWWMLQDPAAGADVLRSFWSTIDSPKG
jgi:pimeloyl-ACP methyl ester carboxylesterase